MTPPAGGLQWSRPRVGRGPQGILPGSAAGKQFHPAGRPGLPLPGSRADDSLGELVTLGPHQCQQMLGFVLSFNLSEPRLPLGRPICSRRRNLPTGRCPEALVGIPPRFHASVSPLVFPKSLPFLQAALGWSPCGRSWLPSRAPMPGSYRSLPSAWPWTFTRWVPGLPRLLRSGLGRLT